MSRRTLTIVSPVYNEEEGIHDFYESLKPELAKLSSYTSDIIFVVDRCSDNTLEILKNIARSDSAVRILALSSRFGYQMSQLAGIDHAKGDAVVTMDSDGQNPPSLLPQLLAEFEKGAHIVHGIRKDTEGLGALRKMQSSIFYWLINKISEVPIIPNASDYRLISQKVATVLREKVRERNLFLRGIFSWLGFKQARVPFVAPPRTKGTTKFSMNRLIQFALLSLVSFSRKPLRAATAVGALFALFGFLFAVVTVVQYFLGAIKEPGYSTVIVMLAIFGGVQLMFLGVIGEYIGAIFDEVKARPHYIVEEAINITD
jgi:polyisoprenyl-phosphate glycosyltransferase